MGQPSGSVSTGFVSFCSSLPWAFFSRTFLDGPVNLDGPVSQAVRAMPAARSSHVAKCRFISIAPKVIEPIPARIPAPAVERGVLLPDLADRPRR